jgi:hypothetical protein
MKEILHPNIYHQMIFGGLLTYYYIHICRAGEPEPEPGVFGSLEPEPVKISRLLSPREDKKHKEIVL